MYIIATMYIYNIHRFHSLYHNKLSHRTHTKTQSFCFFSDEQCKTKKWLLSFDTGDEILSGSTGIMKTHENLRIPLTSQDFITSYPRDYFISRVVSIPEPEPIGISMVHVMSGICWRCSYISCEHWKNPGCLGYRRDYTTQLSGTWL